MRTAIAITVCAALALVTSATAHGDIVLDVSTESVRVGKWSVVSDSAALGGAKVRHPDGKAEKILTVSAEPMDCFELTFTATAGVPYHLWLHGRADRDNWANDSVFVQGNTSGKTRNTRIDYAFHSKQATRLTLKKAQVFDSRDSTGVMPSDHRPLMTTFEVK
jgi:hypothetical protein